jgi:hypothetical protein
MKKPNWVCSNCSMWSSRKSSVKRHIQNVYRGNSNLVSFIDYMAGRRSGFYFPSPRPTYEKSGAATTTVTVMDTFKDEFWKSVATKAANKASSPSLSPIQNHQFNFQQFGSNGAPYYYPSQLYSDPSLIPKPEEIFGFKVYSCKKCFAFNTIILSFNDGKEGGSELTGVPAAILQNSVT